MLIASCFYAIKSKFSVQLYNEWINNFLQVTTSNENNKIVIFTNKLSRVFIPEFNNVTIIELEFEDFYLYKYKDNFINNHKKNIFFTGLDWRLVMLWCQKIWFIKYALTLSLTDDNWVNWCDIGYFRCRNEGPMCDLQLSELNGWGTIPEWFDSEYIYYGLVVPSSIPIIKNMIRNKINIPPHQISIAGGFFICSKSNLDWWETTFENKLIHYFNENILIKDDQLIIIDCICSEDTGYKFKLLHDNSNYDPWFPFQRFLQKNNILS
jgi:hypothetical protein